MSAEPGSSDGLVPDADVRPEGSPATHRHSLPRSPAPPPRSCCWSYDGASSPPATHAPKPRNDWDGPKHDGGRRSAWWCRSLPVPHSGLHEGGAPAGTRGTRPAHRKRPTRESLGRAGHQHSPPVLTALPGGGSISTGTVPDGVSDHSHASTSPLG